MQLSLQRVLDSILAADIGSIWTHVILIDRVNGEYRFVASGDAPTTIEAPHGDLMVGLRAAIREVEHSTGRHLLDDNQNLILPEGADGRGVDLFIATSSAAPPLKVAVGGLVERVSGASAIRAARSTYSHLTHLFTLDATAGRWGNPRGTLGVVEQLIHDWPDAIVLAGGTEGGAERTLLELIEAIALALQANADRRPPTVIFAGNGKLVDEVQARLGGNSAFMVGENVRPALDTERLRVAGRFLDQQFRLRQLSQLPGGGALRSWSNSDLLPTVEALSRVVQYLALRDERRVLGVDVGGASAALAVTFENLVTQTMVRTDLGIITDAEQLVGQVGRDALAGWVPGITAPDALIHEYLNLSLHPSQYPMTEEALRLLQGATREVLRLLLQDAIEGWLVSHQPGLTPHFDVILGSGSAIRQAPRPEQALAILVDGLQPTGITHLLRDRFGLIAAIGALADIEPQAAADLIEAQGFESLGVVITPVGRAQLGEEVLRFRLRQGEGVSEGVVEYGQSYRFPTTGETELELRPTRQMDIGFGPGVGTTLTRSGDSVGFVIDARGRPLGLPSDLQARRDRVEEWLHYVGA